MHVDLYKCTVCRAIVFREIGARTPTCAEDSITMTRIGESFLALFTDAGPITPEHMEGSK